MDAENCTTAIVTMITEAVISETSLSIYRNIRRCIPEDSRFILVAMKTSDVRRLVN
jgi:hypothetical protein